MNLLEISDQYTKTADDFLQSSRLVEVLTKYGRVEYEGAYAGKVMMDGDIDIKIIRENEFTTDDMFTLLRDLYDTCGNSFRSYFLKRDWDDPRIGKQFPNGQYIGLKTYIGDERWKCDIWFMDESESIRDRQKIDISKTELTTGQRKTILEFKQYRKENKLKVSGQEIYEAVLEEENLEPEAYFQSRN
jgi:hypothetical protein